MRTPHTSYHKGTTLRIKLKNGEVFVDKFEDHKSGFMVLRNRGRIAIKDIQSCSINKADAPNGQ